MSFLRRRRAEQRPQPPDPVLVATGYHQRTKHHPHRFAASLGYLDWDSQPDPFRRYHGARLCPLPHPACEPEGGRQTDEQSLDMPRAPSDPGFAEIPYRDLFARSSQPPGPLTVESISDLLYHSLALSAWKSAEGNHWSLRVNPSSGNLHPTEATLLLPALTGSPEFAQPGVFHYAPREHGLERRAELDASLWSALRRTLPEGSFFVLLSSIPWRESWKYGERAYRYCQHDVGHALGALRFGAALQGWTLRVLPCSDSLLESLLGTSAQAPQAHPQEPELAEVLAVISPSNAPASGSLQVFSAAEERQLIARFDTLDWQGKPNQLSPEHHPWDLVDVVAAACRSLEPASSLPASAEPSPAATNLPWLQSARDVTPPAARALVRRRRSAMSLDGRSSMPLQDFQRLLASTVPRLSPSLWDAWPFAPAVHLGLFVHRVEGLTPGLYALLRDDSALDELKAAMHQTFSWEHPEEISAQLPLYRLAKGDLRRPAANMSCNQDIAGDGAFSLGMLAAFDATLASRGACGYRELFWETGLIGQVLYLEAEAGNLSGTGIGCFFDDSVHSAFGLNDTRWQSLYHFTVGAAVHDERISGLPAYPAPDANPR